MGTGLDFFRKAEWLDSERVRAYSLILLLGSLALVVIVFFRAMGEDGSDFLAFWSAARVALTGNYPGAYDIAVVGDVQATTGFGEVFAFVNPPPFLFAVIPFGALGFAPSWIAWVLATYALWAFASCRAFPRYWPLVLAFPGALVAAIHAQNGLLTGALLVGGVALAERRPWLGGALIGALVIKPHLALLMPFWLAAGGKWRAFLAAGLSAIGLLLLSWLAFGTETMFAYTQSWAVSEQIMEIEDPGFYLRMATLYGQVRIFLGHEIALGASIVLSAAMIALVWASWKRFGCDMAATGALALAATPLASPYLFNYDLPFLIFPVLWLAQRWQARGFGDWHKLSLILLYLAPLATRALALPLGVNLMPLFSAAMVWLIWSEGKRALVGTT